MLIHKFEVPNEMVERHAKVVTELENNYSASLERARSELHNDIFAVAGCCRDLAKRDDRKFSTALNKKLIDIMWDGDETNAQMEYVEVAAPSGKLITPSE